MVPWRSRRTGNGRTILCVPVSRLSAEGTLENPTTEWVPKVQSGVFPRQSLRQKYGDEIRPISVGRGFFSILFFRALSGDGAFLSPFLRREKNAELLRQADRDQRRHKWLHLGKDRSRAVNRHRHHHDLCHQIFPDITPEDVVESHDRRHLHEGRRREKEDQPPDDIAVSGAVYGARGNDRYG